MVYLYKTKDMSIATISKKSPNSKRLKQPKPISWELFEKKYLTREDSWKYEWVNGLVEKTKRSMNQEQLYIISNLRKLFTKLTVADKVEGVLENEIDTFFLEKVHRRPDMAWFSEEQEIQMAHGQNQVPNFVIEIISNNDKARKLQAKMKNYRDAGVEVIWLIYPNVEEVIVCRGDKMEVCHGDKLCTADPAIPAFSLPTKTLFEKPLLQTNE